MKYYLSKYVSPVRMIEELLPVSEQHLTVGLGGTIHHLQHPLPSHQVPHVSHTEAGVWHLDMETRLLWDVDWCCEALTLEVFKINIFSLHLLQEELAELV